MTMRSNLPRLGIVALCVAGGWFSTFSDATIACCASTTASSRAKPRHLAEQRADKLPQLDKR